MRSILLFSLVAFCIYLVGCTQSNNPNIGNSSSKIDDTNNCPQHGFMQAEVDYCVDLCMFETNKTSTLSCNSICINAERIDDEHPGYNSLPKRIAKYRCDKCGDCTSEQIAEKQKNVEEMQQLTIQNECMEKCRNETAKVKDCSLEKQKCTDFQQKCELSCQKGNFIPYEQTQTKIDDDKEIVAAQQKKDQLEEALNSQSTKFDGYIFIENTSGEPRQITDNGVTYDFAVSDPIKVPIDLGRKLIDSGYFKLVIN